jgi:hypothetical protein
VNAPDLPGVGSGFPGEPVRREVSGRGQHIRGSVMPEDDVEPKVKEGVRIATLGTLRPLESDSHAVPFFEVAIDAG